MGGKVDRWMDWWMGRKTECSRVGRSVEECTSGGVDSWGIKLRVESV